MAQTVADQDLISIAESEQEMLRDVAHFVDQVADGGFLPLELVGPNGDSVTLPTSILQVLRVAARHLAKGQAIRLIAVDRELTTQQAADLLNVSRPYLVKLLEHGEIPYTKTGRHRRVRLADLMSYKARRDGQRMETLAELTQLSQRLGLYDV
jgi:excisionase family DNA binding protein